MIPLTVLPLTLDLLTPSSQHSAKLMKRNLSVALLNRGMAGKAQQVLEHFVALLFLNALESVLSERDGAEARTSRNGSGVWDEVLPTRAP